MLKLLDWQSPGFQGVYHPAGVWDNIWITIIQSRMSLSALASTSYCEGSEKEPCWVTEGLSPLMSAVTISWIAPTPLLWFSVCRTGKAVELFYHWGNFTIGLWSGRWSRRYFSVERFCEFEGLFQHYNSIVLLPLFLTETLTLWTS